MEQEVQNLDKTLAYKLPRKKLSLITWLIKINLSEKESYSSNN